MLNKGKRVWSLIDDVIVNGWGGKKVSAASQPSLKAMNPESIDVRDTSSASDQKRVIQSIKCAGKETMRRFGLC